ncbi:protein YIF1B-B [Diorhabda sublineata]|uniref:protein YIF1B-B n=1 Tax=Diorhabda sublineata TaxID=1163346 RepID=UPI0024E0AE81|nr:protein YIF1B-B [Diorhabda sublineata]
MNYNANTGGRPSLGRKLKRVPATMPQQPNMYPTLDPGMNNFQQGYTSMDTPPQVTSTPNISSQRQNLNQPFNINPLASGTPNISVLGQPVVQDMALQYGQQLAGAGTTMLKNEVEKIVPISKLKYYFAVDTKYVISKMLLLFFPFTHKDWSVKYEQESPIQPRYEINAPDLYIPVMGYVTYVVTAGLVLGMQNRFSPEQIGILASSALAWWVVELAIYSGTLYVIQVQISLRTLDLLAYSGYKFVGTIFSIAVSLIAGRLGYYVCLVYSSFALAFFLVRSLKVQVLSESVQETSYYGSRATTTGHKRRRYFLLFLAAVQPVLSWWLSFHLLAKESA